MENSAKEKRQYIIINVLLILIVLLLGVYIYKVIQSNKQQIKVGYEQGVNVVQQLQDEYINVEKVETTENQDTMIVPIIDSYSGEYNFNVVTNNKYYYNQLDNTAKLIYDTIESNLSNMTSGNYEIKLSSQIADVLYEDYGENKLDTSFQSAWDALMIDRVDTFFIILLFRSNPCPLSETRISKEYSPIGLKVTSTALARECFSTLVRASRRMWSKCTWL